MLSSAPACNASLPSLYSPQASAAAALDVPRALHFYLRSICTAPSWMIIKWDAQPAAFPSVVRLGGDVDILAAPMHFSTLRKATTAYWGRAALADPSIHVRELSRTAHNWQLRLERRHGGRRTLVYQVHLIEAATEELQSMLARRRQPLGERSAGLSPCLWAPQAADDVHLRELDCKRDAAKGRPRKATWQWCAARMAGHGAPVNLTNGPALLNG